jgi:hypothetical protein
MRLGSSWTLVLLAACGASSDQEPDGGQPPDSGTDTAPDGGGQPPDPDSGPDPAPEPEAPSDSGLLFDDEVVQVLRIELSADAIAQLEAEPTQWVQGAVEWEGWRFENAGVRLKGQSSFLPIHEKASFKIKFDEFVEHGDFLGLEELTLNNMHNDPTMLRERLAYRVFREAGVPAPRCSHVEVWVNSERYGVYANVETVDDRMLARWFEDPDGPLFEAWDVDFVPELIDAFEHEDGPDDRTALWGLADALGEGTPDEAVQAAARWVDWDEFRRYWATATVVGQFDAYPFHLDDVHLYQDPATGLLSFIPWGTDESFNAGWDLRWVFGLLAQTCALSRPCIEAWVWDVVEVLDLAEEMDLPGLADQAAEQIAPLVERDILKPYANWQVAEARDELRLFISERRTDIYAVFDAVAEE